MARRIATVDTWKKKIWYEIYAPSYFQEKFLGETPADAPEKVINRRVEVTYPELFGTFEKHYLKMYFRIIDVQGTKCKTEFDGHDLAREYLVRIVMRRTSRIDHRFIVETKDGRKIVIKPIVITRGRCSYNQKRSIRKLLEKEISEKAKGLNFDEFILYMVTEKLCEELTPLINKIYPVKNFHIRKSEVIRE